MNRKLKLNELNRKSVDDFKSSEKIPVIMVLDNIRSHHNVGSIFRTADAFGFEAVYLCGYTPVPPHREIHKTALGATDSVHWKHFTSVTDAIGELQQKGYTVVSIEQAERTVPLTDFPIEKGKKYAVIMGNEVEGVGQEAVDASDVVIEIPQIGTKHSLNVSVCAGVVMWELFKLNC